MWTYIGMGLAGGALAFAHCLGMCGGFALHLSRAPGRWGVLGRQLLWHAGKTFTYVFLGAMAGFVGGWAGTASAMPWVQKTLAFAAGAAMILMGMAILGLLPRRPRNKGNDEWRMTNDESMPNAECRMGKDESASARRATSEIRNPQSAIRNSLLSSVFRQFFREPTPAGALILGLATGFLPCPIVVGFLALSVQSGSVVAGMATMAAMGVGSVWALLLLGMTGNVLAIRFRRQAAAAAGAVLILLGAATALRGTEAFHQILGCPHPPQPDAPAQPDRGSCCQP